MKVTTIGLDLAKDVFQVCAADASGKTLYNKQLRRSQMAEFFTKLPACLIGVEACGSAHYWARKLLAMGHHREATGRGDPCTQKKAASTAAENITFATNIIAADD